MITQSLNHLAHGLLNDVDIPLLKIRVANSENDANIYDFGVQATGSLNAGLLLANACLAGYGAASLTHTQVNGNSWPALQVVTDNPLKACLFSQYAGWKISVDKYFAMGSGPMRAVAAREELYEKLDFKEDESRVLGVLETSTVPTADVVSYIAERCHVSPENVTLLVAPTSSIAGTMQVVARSVETAMHKLFELEFDVANVYHGFGVAPIPPIAKDDMAGIGLTNDAILYGGEVTLWVTAEDDQIAEIGPRVPSCAADCHGQPFLEIFKAAEYDFYKIDPMLFSPAMVTIHNLATGRVHQFGESAPDVLRKSFGI
jgi:methenyltetrahydromethanopterin cyclohydrolase